MSSIDLNSFKHLSIHEQEHIFTSIVLENKNVSTILDRTPELGLDDWYLTAGGIFQTVWNSLTGRQLTAGIKDYDLFYFDSSGLSYEAEDVVITKAAALFSDLHAEVEVRNEARVHIWYEEKFGVPGKPFKSCEDAIDHFASQTCCYGIRKTPDGAYKVYAPHGFDNLFSMTIVPNPVLAPQDVYESKTERWLQEWPTLTVLPWPA
jgi:hypothetical protein